MACLSFLTHLYVLIRYPMQPVPTIVPFMFRFLEQALLVILFSIALLGSGTNFHIRQCHQYHLTVLNVEQLNIKWGILSLLFHKLTTHFIATSTIITWMFTSISIYVAICTSLDI